MAIDPVRWQRLSPWLDQLLEQPVEQREAWLDALAGQQPGLAAELSAVLRGDTHADPLALPPAWSAPVALAGRRIGAYTLVEQLGEGGMGVVWLAKRSDGHFEGRAAVKLLHAGVVQRALEARFRREGAILARLAHPHIARLVDAGLTEQGQPYLVLEHVAGERIDRWCDARQMGPRARIGLFDQVMQAVQHAHAQLVVHRDLKPANVMVDEQGQVKLLDFGIAKLLDDEGAPAETTQLTREGTRALTPMFAAPEQLRGEAVTTATDVYALGLLLFRLLTGQHARGTAPAGEAPLASRVVVDAQRADDDELQAAAQARGSTPARLAASLAGDLDNILAKALRPEPGERYGTVAAFADDLRRHLDGHTVSARPDSVAYRVSRFVGRHRLGVGLGAVAVGAFVSAAGVAELQRREVIRERDAVVRQRANAEAVSTFLEEQLGLLGLSLQKASPGERVDAAQQRAQQLFHDQPDVLARLHVIFHNLNVPLDRPAARRQNLDVLAASLPKIDDPVVRAEATCVAAWREESLATGMARIDRTLGELPDAEGSRFVRSKCLAIRSLRLRVAGRLDEALDALEASREVASETQRRMQGVAYLRNKGWLLGDLARPHEADRMFRMAAEAMQSAGQGESVRMASDQSWRAMFHLRMGRPREGLDLVRRAAALADAPGEGGPALPFVPVVTARLLLDLERDAEARTHFERALLRDGRVQTLFARSLDFTALAHRARGESEEAVLRLQEDLRQYGGKGGPLRDAMNRMALAGELLELGRAQETMEALGALGDGPETRAFEWERRWLAARALHRLNQPLQAESEARAAVAAAAISSPPEGRSALHGRAYLELARALAGQGRADEARAAAERALAELDDALGPEHSATRAARQLARR